MADEGASSSCNSAEEVDSRQDNQPLPNPTDSSSSNTNENPAVSSSTSTNCSNQTYTSNVSNDVCTVVSSSSHQGSSSQGILRMSRLTPTPFSLKPSAPIRSVADSTDSKDARPIIAPPTFKLGCSESSSISTCIQDNNKPVSASKIVLRPSALSIQAEKLKLLNKHDSSIKQEGKENSDENNIAKDSLATSSESNGKLSKEELFTSGIAVQKELSSPLKNSAATESSFSLSTKNSDEQSSSNGSFIFGQNLHERVLQPSPASDAPPNLTFEEAALKKEELEKMERQNQEEKLKSLSESAKEYESKQVKRKFEEVTVITGEEEESNVLQINCKLFSFDKVNMNWLERGRGILRLNDRECNGSLHSRVVMRTQGSLRVMLNTKVWAGMTVEHPSVKTVRLTAYDPQGVKVFLVQAQPKDAEQLFQALTCRVNTLKHEENYQTRQSSEDGESQESRVEEATSSSSSFPATFEPQSPPRKIHASDSSGCFGADSSSETNFVPHNNSTLDGNADSTDVQS